MSWPQWAATAQPPLQATAAAAAAANILNPAAGSVLNSPATVLPPGIQYTPDQWAQLQQQNWTQWAQWQQQYQQWHQQYGAEYQKSLSALSTQITQQTITPSLPNLGVPPPLPIETKPPLPLDDPPINQQSYPNYNTTSSSTTTATVSNYNTTVQNKLPETNRNNWQQSVNKRNFEQSQQNFDPDPKRQMLNKPQWSNQQQPQQQQKPQQSQVNTIEELSEAEKKFDKQFAEWEAQFNKWKEQNAEHPDKQQYKEYEKKWESWRAQLLERREQMRRKRLGLLADNTRTQQFPKETPQIPTVLSTSKSDEISINNNKDDGGIFLKTSTSSGIPGLDLVDNDIKNDDDLNRSTTMNTTISNTTGPDLDAISKGINSILGDQKLLTMLSMVSQNQNIIINDQLINTQPQNRNDNLEIRQTITTNSIHNEQSNHSHDDYSNHNNDKHNQSDFVTNFDDQTRSSFTTGQNDNDLRYDNNNYNRNQSRYEPTHFNNNRFNNDNFNNNNNNNNRFCPRNDNFDDYNDTNRQLPYRDRQYDDERLNSGKNYNTRQFDNDFEQIRSFNDAPIGPRSQYNHDNDYRQNFDDDRNYDRINPSNSWTDQQNDIQPPPPPSAVAIIDNENIPLEEQIDILEPVTVVDYDHKPLKPPEPEILIEPIRMFDYRHKSLSRIPLPQRPKWLSETVKNIREFDPPVVRPYEPQNLRRYTNIDNWRNERLYPEDSWTRYKDNHHHHQQHHHHHHLYNERRLYQDNRSHNDEDDDHNNKRNRQFNQFNDNKLVFDDKKNNYKDDYEENTKNRYFDESTSKRLESERYNSNNNNKSDKLEINRQITLIEDLINPPGRHNRPPRICIILRGPPGSGKTFLAKLIKDKEVENGGSAPRILSLDDYFMVEQEKEIVEDGKKVKIKEMIYEYEAEMEESYRVSLVKSFKKTITDGYFPFIIVDNVNDKVKYFGEMWSFAKQNGFQVKTFVIPDDSPQTKSSYDNTHYLVYICQLDLDVQSCSKRNIHGRSESEIDKLVANWEATPTHHPILDATSLLQSGSIADVEMEEVNSPESDCFNDDDHVGGGGNDDDDNEEEEEEEDDQVTRSKWDNFDCSNDNLAKLDGVSKPLRPSRTMEEYLQMDVECTPTTATRPGQKRVRWADLEEQKEQAKMRAIGFVVGQTDWGRMMDPTMGGSALTQTKYIERTGRY